MKVKIIDNAEILNHSDYLTDEQVRLAQVSSVGDNLWIGKSHHLGRDEVKKLIKHLQSWVDTGSLKISRPS